MSREQRHIRRRCRRIGAAQVGRTSSWLNERDEKLGRRAAERDDLTGRLGYAGRVGGFGGTDPWDGRGRHGAIGHAAGAIA